MTITEICLVVIALGVTVMAGDTVNRAVWRSRTVRHVVVMKREGEEHRVDDPDPEEWYDDDGEC